MKKLIAFIISVVGVYGQQIAPSALNVAPNVLQNVSNISLSKSVTVGQANYYYWVVTRYGVGNTTLSTPVSALQVGTGTITIGWNPPTNPAYGLKFDVLRTTNSQFPVTGSCTNCLVISGTANNTATDTVGASLSSYSLNTYTGTGGYYYLDIINSSIPAPFMNISGNMISMGVTPVNSLPTYCYKGQMVIYGSNTFTCNDRSVWGMISTTVIPTVNNGTDVICAKGGDTITGLVCNNSIDATTATAFNSYVTIPANLLNLRGIILNFPYGIIVTGSGPTMTISIFMGTTEVFRSPATAPGSAGSTVAGYMCSITSVGISSIINPIVASCGVGQPASGGVTRNTLLSNTTKAINVDTTIDQNITMKLTWSTNTAGNAMWLYGAY